MAYNRWLCHYGVKGMKWRHHIRNPIKEASDRFGYTAYKEYKGASAEERKAWENYQSVAGYNSWLSKDDDSKKAREKWRTAAFFKSEAYNKYKGTPMYKAQKKIEKGKQLVRDIVSAFKKFKG